MNFNQKSLMLVAAVLLFLGSLTIAEDSLAPAPAAVLEDQIQDPVVAAPAPDTLLAAKGPAPAILQNPAPALTGHPALAGPAAMPTGEAVTTETRTPDGSVITVTRFNGQMPHGMFPQHYPGFWHPFGYGLPRPLYNYPAVAV